MEIDDEDLLAELDAQLKEANEFDFMSFFWVMIFQASWPEGIAWHEWRGLGRYFGGKEGVTCSKLPLNDDHKLILKDSIHDQLEEAHNDHFPQEVRVLWLRFESPRRFIAT